jgi:hypothetical protein
VRCWIGGEVDKLHMNLVTLSLCDRSCTAPSPAGGGRMCQGERVETNDCFLRLCGVSQIKIEEKGKSMNQITIKTPNPKCRLYWCLIEFID